MHYDRKLKMTVLKIDYLARIPSCESGDYASLIVTLEKSGDDCMARRLELE
jgi:hypothetical protein